MNTLIIIYIAGIKPLKRRNDNKLEVFNECIIHAATIHMFLFTDWVEKPATQFAYGWSLLSIIGIGFAVNLSLVFKKGVHLL